MVYVPIADYMLALKLKAVRVLDPLKGRQESEDIRNLLKVAGISDRLRSQLKFCDAISRVPRADPAKQLFLLKHLIADAKVTWMRPDTLSETYERIMPASETARRRSLSFWTSFTPLPDAETAVRRHWLRSRALTGDAET